MQVRSGPLRGGPFRHLRYRVVALHGKRFVVIGGEVKDKTTSVVFEFDVGGGWMLLGKEEGLGGGCVFWFLGFLGRGVEVLRKGTRVSFLWFVERDDVAG